ncbi:hypothetical protein STEG23_024595, partial [Scotinomys teguina]
TDLLSCQMSALNSIAHHLDAVGVPVMSLKLKRTNGISFLQTICEYLHHTGKYLEIFMNHYFRNITMPGIEEYIWNFRFPDYLCWTLKGIIVCSLTTFPPKLDLIAHQSKPCTPQLSWSYASLVPLIAMPSMHNAS